MIRLPACIVIGLASLAIAPASAQTWPAKSVRIVVPFAAGGPADVFARIVGQRLQEGLGQTFVVENRPGAGAVIGTDLAAKSPADGYTLLMMSNTHTANESLVPKKPYELMRDFAPVAPINYSDLVLIVHPSVGITTVKQLVDLAKRKPRALNYASSGTGTPYHFAGELLKSMAGIEIVHVPYKGSSGARTDVLGGQVEMMFDAITTMAPNVIAGKVKALGTTGKARSAVLPQVPTVSEAGVPGYETVIWLGIMAPTGTPAAVVERLNGEIGRIVARPDVKEGWRKQGAETLSMNPDQFGQYIRDDITKWAKLVKAANIKAD